MIKKTLPLCVVLVMMVAGVAQATEWPHVSFTLPTDTWGDLTFHQTDLDQQGNDVTTGGNTVAADGWDNWAGNIGQWPLEEYGQWDVRTPAYEADYVGKMDAAAYVLQTQTHTDHSQRVTQIAVPEGAYDVFVVYLSIADGPYGEMHTGLFASTSLTGPLTKFKYDSGEIVDTSASAPDPPTWHAYVAKVGTVIGSTVTVRASNASDDLSELFGTSLYWGVCIRPAFKEIVVEPTAVEVAEAGAAATVTVTLTDQPDSDVTITVTPSGANVLDYYLDAEDPNDPVDLVFTSADWAPKTLTITAVDDFEVETAFEEALVALSISTSDPCYVDYPLPDIAVDVLDNDAGAAHAYVAGRLVGTVNDATSLFFPIGQPSAGDLLEGATGVLDPAPAGSGPVLLGSDASDLVDGELYGDEALPTRSFSSSANGLFICNSCGDGIGTVTYTGLGGVDIAKISIYAGDAWTGDMDVAVYADNGSGFTLLYATGFIDAPRGEYRLDISSLGGPMQTLATGVVGLKFVFDVSAATDFVYIWEIDAFAVPTIQVSPDSTAVVEGGATDTIDFELLAEPADDVTIDFTVDAAQLTVTPNPLVIPKADWATPLSVTVEAVDDEVLEGDPHTSPLKWFIDDADPNTGGRWVEIGENDCGAWGYLQMDFNTDCTVDLEDLAAFAAQYLLCTRPNDPACLDER